MSELAGNGEFPGVRAWEGKIHARVQGASHKVAAEILAADGLGAYFSDLDERIAPERFATTETIQRTVDAAYPSVSPNTAVDWAREMQRIGLLTGYVTGHYMIAQFERDDFDVHVSENFRQLQKRVTVEPTALTTEIASTGKERYDEQALYIDARLTGLSAFTHVLPFHGSSDVFWNSFGYTLGMACTYLRMVGIHERTVRARKNEPNETIRMQEASNLFAMREAARALGRLTELTWEEFQPFVDGAS